MRSPDPVSWRPCHATVGLVVALAVVLTDLALATLDGLALQPATRTQAGQSALAAGTARLSGQVVAADTGAPVRRARLFLSGPFPVPAPRPQSPSLGSVVSLSGSPLDRREAETDAAGHFEFSQLPAGRYGLLVAPPPGYVRPTSSAPLVLEEGKETQRTIQLDRAGVITGVVSDETGDPVQRAQVLAWRRSSSALARGWSLVVSSATTNDLGQYRLFDLPADDYIVSATYTPRGFSPGAGPRPGYAPTYHPSTASASAATRVSVRAGHETTGIDIVLQPSMLGVVAGVVTDSTGGSPSTGATVSLRPRDSTGAASADRSA